MCAKYFPDFDRSALSISLSWHLMLSSADSVGAALPSKASDPLLPISVMTLQEA